MGLWNYYLMFINFKFAHRIILSKLIVPWIKILNPTVIHVLNSLLIIPL